MRNIHKFQTESDFNTFLSNGGYTEPHVSWTVATDKVNYNFDQYTKEPLTFEILNDGVIKWQTVNMGSSYPSLPRTIEYKLNDGEWTSITSATSSAPTISVIAGDVVQFRGDNNYYGYSMSNYNTFSGTTATFNVKGNILSLFNSTNFIGVTTSSRLDSLFSNCDLLIDASNLKLPITTLPEYAYESMFKNCTSLIAPPTLPATTLSKDCYYSMFEGCTSLASAPELPATTLADSCYQYMFRGCVSLTTAPTLPATTLVKYCYSNMFYNCTSLTSAPELPATTLASQCCTSMFSGCTSLTSAPALPATTLAGQCYQYMFYNCTSLTSTPALPATTLAASCYYGMFNGCTSLTSAPALPATTLATYCYQYMFSNCTNLNYVKAMFTTTPSTSYTSGWLSGVAPTGTFVKNAEAAWDVTGVDGIPSGWTVETATA